MYFCQENIRETKIKLNCRLDIYMYIVRTNCNYVTRCMAVCRKIGLTKLYASLPRQRPNDIDKRTNVFS